jgi:hypothetical protein
LSLKEVEEIEGTEKVFNTKKKIKETLFRKWDT